MWSPSQNEVSGLRRTTLGDIVAGLVIHSSLPETQFQNNSSKDVCLRRAGEGGTAESHPLKGKGRHVINDCYLALGECKNP